VETTEFGTGILRDAFEEIEWPAQRRVRCRFIDDRYDFENFMQRLWQLKKLTFISVRS
jgi:hypothetical protein